MVKIRRYSAPLTRTSGRGNKRKYITIHETANRGRGANANAHARLQAGTNSRQASWHYQVDSTEVVQSFDDDVRCWHAGAKANNESIAIEICVNSDGNYQKALDNAAALVAHLRKKHGIPWNRIVSHKFWTGKNCPTIMLGRSGQWDKFIAATGPKGASKVEPAATSKPKGTLSVSDVNKIMTELNKKASSNQVNQVYVRQREYQNETLELIDSRASKTMVNSVYVRQREYQEETRELIRQLAEATGTEIDYDLVREAAKKGSKEALAEGIDIEAEVTFHTPDEDQDIEGE